MEGLSSCYDNLVVHGLADSLLAGRANAIKMNTKVSTRMGNEEILWDLFQCPHVSVLLIDFTSEKLSVTDFRKKVLSVPTRIASRCLMMTTDNAILVDLIYYTS